MKYKGSIYHPNLFDFDLALGIAPSQLKEKNDQLSVTKHKFRKELLTDLNLDAQILKGRDIYSGFFINKRSQEENRDFFERQTDDQFAYGQQIGFRNKFVPMEFSYNHNEDEISRSFRPNINSKEDVIEYSLKPIVPTLKEIQIDYKHESFSRKEDDLSNQKGNINSLTASNNYKFGNLDENYLNSYMNLYDLNSENSNKDFTLNENLTLTHSDEFKSLYQYNFYDRSSNQTESKENMLDLGVQHQLFESLTSSFSIKGSTLNSTTFDEYKSGYLWKEEYRKRLGPSQLFLGFELDFEHKIKDSFDTFFNVVQETHLLDDANIVFLNQSNIEINSIVVTNASGSIIYTRDVDYQIIAHDANRTEIKRIFAGSISNGQQILVSYTVNNNQSYRYDQYQTGFHSGLNFFQDRLKFYQSIRQRRLDNLKNVEGLVVDKYTDAIIGSNLNLGWSDTTLEYEDYDSSLIPFKATRLSQIFQHRLTSKTDLMVSGRSNRVLINDEARKIYDVRGTINYYLSSTSSYKLEMGQLWQNGQGLDEKRQTLRNVFHKRLNRLQMEFGYEHEWQKFINEKKVNDYVYTKFKRDF